MYNAKHCSIVYDAVMILDSNYDRGNALAGGTKS